MLLAAPSPMISNDIMGIFQVKEVMNYGKRRENSNKEVFLLILFAVILRVAS